MTTSGYGQLRARPGGFGQLSQLRASDADRETVTWVLREAFAEGRLTPAEYEARLGGALTAQIYADLDAVVADLPVPIGPAEPRTNALAIAALMCGLVQPLTLMLTTIPAIVLGHIARGQIRRTGDEGKSLATWGLVLGWSGAAMAGLTIIMFLLIVAHLAAGL